MGRGSISCPPPLALAAPSQDPVVDVPFFFYYFFFFNIYFYFGWHQVLVAARGIFLVARRLLSRCGVRA